MKLVILLLLASACFAQDIKRPTSEADAGVSFKCGVGTKQMSSSMPQAYDSIGQSTSSSLSVQAQPGQFLYSSRSFRGWPAPSGSYSSLILSVNSQDAVTLNGQQSPGVSILRYSIDGGATWANMLTANQAGWGRQTSTATLSANQDLSQVVVEGCVNSQSVDSFGPKVSLIIFDIWTAGTMTPQGAGTGASSGSPHRGMVIVN